MFWKRKGIGCRIVQWTLHPGWVVVYLISAHIQDPEPNHVAPNHLQWRLENVGPGRESVRGEHTACSKHTAASLDRSLNL